MATFNQRTGNENPFNGFNLVNNSAPVLADIDGDGDLDGVVGDSFGAIRYLRNNGSATNPQYRQDNTSSNPFSLISQGSRSSPALGNIDGGGNLEALIGDNNGNLAYYKRIGNTYQEQTGNNNPFNGVTVGYSSNPVFADLDGDGDLDVVVGELDGNLTYFLNEGTSTSPSYVQLGGSANPFNTIDIGFRSTPTLGDIDGDGDLDLVLGDNNGTLSYFENTGSATAPVYIPQTGNDNPFNNVDLGSATNPALADVDGDGDLDLVVGEFDGTLNYFERDGIGPNAVDDTFTITLNSISGTFDLLIANVINGGGNGADSAGDGTSLTVTAVNGAADNVGQEITLPSGALLRIRDSGRLDYNPNGEFPEGGNDTFTYAVSNGVNGTDTATVTIILQVPPVAQDDNNISTFATNADTAFTTGNVLDNDSDANGDELTIVEVNGTAITIGDQVALPSGALVTLNVDGTFDYDPNGQFDSLIIGETDTNIFTYTISDGNGNTDSATVTITITGVNEVPVAQDDGLPDFAAPTTNPFGLTTADFSTAPTFVDINGDGLLDVVVVEFDGNINYFENIGTATSPSFASVQLNPFGLTNVSNFAAPAFADIDGDGDLDAFVGNYDTLNYFENTGTATSPSFASVQTNPFGLTGLGLYITPTLVDIDSDGDLDLFVGGNSGIVNYFENTGTATSPSFAAAQANPFGLTNVQGPNAPTFVDLDGNLDAVIGDRNGILNYFENTGTATNPSFTTVQTNPFGLTDVGRLATPTFADIDNDGDLDALIGEADGLLNFFENTQDPFITEADSTFTTGNVLANDSDGNGDDLTITEVNSIAINVGNQVALASGALVTLNVDGTFDYDPNGQFDSLAPGAIATDTFTYSISDGNGSSDSATITITINGVNDVPSAQDDSGPSDFTTDEDNAFITGNVLANDSDPDGDTLTITNIDTTGTLGSVIDNGDGTFAYDPNNQFDSLAVGETTTDSFTYTISDGNGGSDTATVTITITGVNDAPIAQDDGIGIFFTTVQTNPFGLTEVEFNSKITLVDIDDDGDLDAFVGEGDGTINFFENTGTTTSPSFAGVQTNPFGLANIGFISFPTLVDIDGDGDFDAFVGESDGTINYFENTGTATSPSFSTAQINPFGLTDVGGNNTPVLVDIDGDGDLDAFVGDTDGNINFFENTGTTTSPSFSTAQIDPFSLTNVGIYSAPTFVDIDSDGDLDAFVGVGSGDTNFFENTGDATNPSFDTAQINPFGLTDVRFRSKPSFVDIDGDGDLDAFIGEEYGSINYFEGTSHPDFTTDEATAFTTGNVLDNDSDPNGDTLTVIGIDTTNTFGIVTNNSDGTFAYDPNGQFESLAVGETATDTFDYTISDGNGSTATATVTITITGVNDAPVAQDDGPTYAEQNDTDNPFNGIDVGVYSTPTFADVDGDGDLDAVVGEYDGNLNYYENTGSATAPVYSEQTGTDNPFNGFFVGYDNAPSFADIDGDGDIDAVVGNSTGSLRYFENTGSAMAPVYIQPTGTDNPFNGINVGSYSTPSFADIDGDGDLDALVGEYFGNLRYFENTGSATEPAYSQQTGTDNPFNGIDVGVYSKPTFTDIDGDGDLDAVVGEGAGNLNYFENTGSATAPVYSRQTGTDNPFNGIDVGGISAPTFADIDGDGDLDAVVGESNGTLNFFKNLGIFFTNEDTAFTTGNVLDNDSDPEGDSLTVISIDTTGTLGSVTDNGDGTFDYDPNGQFAGISACATATDSFTYTISDGNGGTDTATVTITIRPDSELIVGTATGETLFGTANSDCIHALAGDDIIIASPSNDFLDGGQDTDAADYANATSGVTVYLDGTLGSGDIATGDQLQNIERIFGSQFADQLFGDNNNNLFWSRDGADTVFAGAGNDFVYGNEGDDILHGEAGIDALIGGEGDDQLFGGEGADFLDGGEDIDSVDYASAATGVTVYLDGTTLGSGDIATGDQLLNIERIYGSQFADQLFGDDNNNLFWSRDGADTVFAGGGNDLVYGNEGNDILHGEEGIDALIGGEGDDQLFGGEDADFLDGGEDIDSVDYANAATGITVYLDGTLGSGDIATGDRLQNVERLYGSQFADQLFGDDNDNLFWSRNGADTVFAGGGEDRVYGNEGDDILHGEAENDVLVGGVGEDQLFGGDGFDVLFGDSNNDSLTGGADNDSLVGGIGADTFMYPLLSDSLLSAQDRIIDLEIGVDFIDGPSTVSAVELQNLGAVTSLTEFEIQSVLMPGTFVANGAATFSLGSRTFLALNDAFAGFSASTDAVIDITGFTGDLSSLNIS